MDDSKLLINENPIEPIWKIVVVASISAGVMFGAATLSLVIPYVQHLGVPHAWASFIWLCGPLSGMLVQPIVGYTSDRYTSRYGQRKPYIVVGVGLICVSVLIIGYALEVGVALGDSLESATKPRGVALYVLGFWILDVASNMVQDPIRAFLADLSGDNHRRMRMGNGFCSFFMSIGSILGYAATSSGNLYKLLPITHTKVCDHFCANLKTSLFINIVFILCVSTIALLLVAEPKHKKPANELPQPFFTQLGSAFSNLPKPIWLLYLVTALNEVAWFPFMLFNTDWVGKEVYGGVVNGSPSAKALYEEGVREGSYALVLTSFSVGVMSLLVDPLSRVLGGGRKLWGYVNFLLAAILASTVLVTHMAESGRQSMPGSLPNTETKASLLSLFAILGIPQAVGRSVPYALASIFSSESEGAGQGLSLGMLNFAIVIPQMLVAMGSGFWDSLFGGGNLPMFVLSSVMAVLSGIFALIVLPSPSSHT